MASVEFADFECPFCVRASATLAQVLEQYGGDVRLVFRHLPLPFHKRALPGAQAAECAREQRQFWPLHDALLGTNRDLSDEALASRVAELPGTLNMTDWRACFAEQRHDARIQRDHKLAEQFMVRGTPSLVFQVWSLELATAWFSSVVVGGRWAPCRAGHVGPVRASDLSRLPDL